MLEQHQLTLLDVQAGRLNEDLTRQTVFTGRQTKNPGETSLAAAVAAGCDCRIILTRERDWGYIFVGFVSDVEVAQYLFTTLRDGLVARADRDGRLAGIRAGALVRWKNSFLMGAAGEIRQRLLAQKKSEPTRMATVEAAETAEPVVTQEQRYALVEIKQPAVDRFFREQFPHTRMSYSRVRTNYSAVDAGREAGRTIPLQRGVSTSSIASLSE